MTNRNLLFAALASCLTASCAGATALGEPFIRGPVEAITHHASASNLLVGAGPGSQDMCGISATVDEETRYLRRNPRGGRDAASISEIDIGDTVEVYVTGPVAQSCPVQGYASAVVLLAAD